MELPRTAKSHQKPPRAAKSRLEPRNATSPLRCCSAEMLTEWPSLHWLGCCPGAGRGLADRTLPLGWVFWCRGGSRYVKGCWGFPYLQRKRFKVSWFLVSWFQQLFYVFKGYPLHINKFPFHVFDKYEIHIQDLLDFVGRVSIIFRCPPFRKMSNLWVSQNTCIT